MHPVVLKCAYEILLPFERGMGGGGRLTDIHHKFLTQRALRPLSERKNKLLIYNNFMSLTSYFCYFLQIILPFYKQNIARSQKAAQRTSHLLSRCQVVLPKRTLFTVLSENGFCQKLSFVSI